MPGTALRTISGLTWVIPFAAQAQPNYYINATSITAAASGTVIASSSFYTKSVQSLTVTIGGTFGATSFNVTIAGENQFGENVTENIAFTSATVKQSLFCYRRVTSLTINSVVGTIGAATISAGLDPTTAGDMRVPMPAKLDSTAAVKSAQVQHISAAQTTITTVLSPYYCFDLLAVTFTAQNLVSNLVVHLDDSDPNL